MARERESEVPENGFHRIDTNILDEEWVLQPDLAYDYGNKLADARKELEEAKQALEVLEAEKEMAIRSDPAKFGIGKITEKAIQAKLITLKSVRAARQEIIDLQHAVGILSAAVNAVEHRKKALEKLVELHGQQYFASPRTPKNLDESSDSILQKKRFKSPSKPQ